MCPAVTAAPAAGSGAQYLELWPAARSSVTGVPWRVRADQAAVQAAVSGPGFLPIKVSPEPGRARTQRSEARTAGTGAGTSRAPGTWHSEPRPGARQTRSSDTERERDE